MALTSPGKWTPCSCIIVTIIVHITNTTHPSATTVGILNYICPTVYS